MDQVVGEMGGNMIKKQRYTYITLLRWVWLRQGSRHFMEMEAITIRCLNRTKH